MHLHVHINLGGEGREEVKLGDGQAAKRLLELALKWGPIIAAIFGVPLPKLPTADEPREPAVEHS